MDDEFVPPKRMRASKRRSTIPEPQQPAARSKHSALREVAVLAGSVVHGKRQRKPPEAYSDKGADTRRPKTPPLCERLVGEALQHADQRTNREKNGRWLAATVDKRNQPAVAAIKKARKELKEKALSRADWTTTRSNYC